MCKTIVAPQLASQKGTYDDPKKDRAEVVLAPGASGAPCRGGGSLLLPIVAAFLHLHTFYHASSALLTVLEKRGSISFVSLQESSRCLETAAFVAYIFDLMCCYVFDSIPFSRVNNKIDIAIHHVPVIAVIITLAVLSWHAHLDPLTRTCIAHEMVPAGMIAAMQAGQGWGFISSLNEACMCFQRAEMNWRGIQKFTDINSIAINTKDRKMFLRRPMIGLELYYKLLIFTFFGPCVIICLLWILKGYLEAYQKGLVCVGQDKVTALLSMLSSPLVLQVIFSILFFSTLYPGMARRTLKKINQFHHPEEKHAKKSE